MFNFLKPAKGRAPKGKSATPSAPRPSPKVLGPGSMMPLSAAKPLVPAEQALRPMTPERAELIQQALAVHRQKQDVFAELDDEARHKLVLMAMLTLLKEARGEK